MQSGPEPACHFWTSALNRPMMGKSLFRILISLPSHVRLPPSLTSTPFTVHPDRRCDAHSWADPKHFIENNFIILTPKCGFVLLEPRGRLWSHGLLNTLTKNWQRAFGKMCVYLTGAYIEPFIVYPDHRCDAHSWVEPKHLLKTTSLFCTTGVDSFCWTGGGDYEAVDS